MPEPEPDTTTIPDYLGGPPEVDEDPFAGFPEVETPEDTDGTLADAIQDIEPENRDDINDLIESGNGYGPAPSGGGAGGSGGGASTPTPRPTGNPPAAAPAAQPAQNGLLSLLALLGMTGGNQQPAQQAIPEEAVVPFDWTRPLETDPFAPKTPATTMAAGGSIDELLALLQQKG